MLPALENAMKRIHALAVAFQSSAIGGDLMNSLEGVFINKRLVLPFKKVVVVERSRLRRQLWAEPDPTL